MSLLESGKTFTLFFVIALLAVSYYLWGKYAKMHAAGKELPAIHRVDALDAVDELAKRAVELGRPVQFEFGGSYAALNTSETMQTLSGFYLYGYSAQLAARYGGKIYGLITAGQGELVPVLTGILESAYKKEGKLDECHPEYSVQVAAGSKGGGTMIPSTYALRNNASGVICVGPLTGIPYFILGEACMRINATLIAGTALQTGISYMPAYADYYLIGEEIFAAGAYVGKNPVMLGTIVASDIFKYACIGLIVVGTALLNVGSNFIVNLLKV